MKMTKDLEVVVLDHGSGGLLSQDLVQNFIAPILGDRYLGQMEDSMTIDLGTSTQLAMTTDSFVVDPVIFGNGDIGKISICGTVNDLAVSGADPKYLTFSLILEEGFPLKDLRKILESVKLTAIEAGIFIVAGDTKVVGKGAVDKIFINTAGIGVYPDEVRFAQSNIKNDDTVIVSGFLGNHSIHILSLREGLGYETRILSDCAPLNNLIHEIKNEFGNKIHLMRDLTRGGLGAAMNEISSAIQMGIDIDLESLPIQHEVKMASDMLGINPIHLANEGNLCIFCDKAIAPLLIKKLKTTKYGQHSAIVGHINSERKSKVIGLSKYSEETLITSLYGKELPRLC